MSNGDSGMLSPHVSTNLKSKWSNMCEEYWSNPWYFLSPSKAALVSLFLSHLLPFLFTFSVEEAASCRRDRLPKSTSSKPKLDHPNLAKAARQHPWSYALYMPLYASLVIASSLWTLTCWCFHSLEKISEYDKFLNIFVFLVSLNIMVNGYVFLDKFSK
jgi:hypothetical protein